MVRPLNFCTTYQTSPKRSSEFLARFCSQGQACPRPWAPFDSLQEIRTYGILGRTCTSAESVKIASSSPEVVSLESRGTRKSHVTCRPRLAVQYSGQITVSILSKLFSSQYRPDQRSGVGLFCEIGSRLCSMRTGTCCATQRNPPDYVSHARCFTEQSEGGRLLSGPSGRMILQHCHVRILVQALREFGRLSSGALQT